MKGRKSSILIFIFGILLALLITSCSKSSEKNKDLGGKEMVLEQLSMPKEGEEIAVIITNYGDIKVRLFPEIAPKAVENFKTHAQNGYYDGVIFHRVIKDFMIQGGDPSGTGMGGESIWGEPFEDEFHIYYHNLKGSLSMANAGPNTNGSQFFIVQSSNIDENTLSQMINAGEEGGFPESVTEAYSLLGGTPWLDFKHTVFGQVFEGLGIVDEIANVKTGPGDKPVNPVIMEKIEIVEFK